MYEDPIPNTETLDDTVVMEFASYIISFQTSASAGFVTKAIFPVHIPRSGFVYTAKEFWISFKAIWSDTKEITADMAVKISGHT